MAKPLAALTRLLASRAGLTRLDVRAWLAQLAALTRLALGAARGLGDLWLMFRHARMILCSEQVLDYELKTSQ